MADDREVLEKELIAVQAFLEAFTQSGDVPGMVRARAHIKKLQKRISQIEAAPNPNGNGTKAAHQNGGNGPSSSGSISLGALLAKSFGVNGDSPQDVTILHSKDEKVSRAGDLALQLLTSLQGKQSAELALARNSFNFLESDQLELLTQKLTRLAALPRDRRDRKTDALVRDLVELSNISADVDDHARTQELIRQAWELIVKKLDQSEDPSNVKPQDGEVPIANDSPITLNIQTAPAPVDAGTLTVPAVSGANAEAIPEVTIEANAEAAAKAPAGQASSVQITSPPTPDPQPVSTIDPSSEIKDPPPEENTRGGMEIAKFWKFLTKPEEFLSSAEEDEDKKNQKRTS